MNKDSHLIFETYLNEAHAPLELHRTLIDDLLDKIEVEESSVRIMKLIGIRTDQGALSHIGAPSGSLKGRLQRLMGSIRALTSRDVFKKYEELYGITPDDRAKELLRINPKWDSKKDGPLDERLEKLYNEDPRIDAQKTAQEWVNEIQDLLAHDPKRAFMAALDPERKKHMMYKLRGGIEVIFDIIDIGKIDPNNPSNDPNQGLY